MTNFTKPAAFFLAVFISATTLAQTYSGYSDITLRLKADSNTKSVLISNLLEDRVGDVSPIIGTAAWAENNKKFQCRSLLSFNYGILPQVIRPEQITKAELVLQPLEFNTVESLNGIGMPRFTVRRIAEPWEDSLTNWLTQPGTTIDDETIKRVTTKKKWKPVYIDVTDMVKNMMRYGNNGFMIQYDDSLDSPSFLSQWFASAKYEDEKLRPQLWISWSAWVGSRYPNFDIADMSPIPRDFMIQRIPSLNAVPLEPVPVPVIPNDNPPPPPPKNPVKD